MGHVVVPEVLDLTARGRETLLDGETHSFITGVVVGGSGERGRERRGEKSV